MFDFSFIVTLFSLVLFNVIRNNKQDWNILSVDLSVIWFYIFWWRILLSSLNIIWSGGIFPSYQKCQKYTLEKQVSQNPIYIPVLTCYKIISYSIKVKKKKKKNVSNWHRGRVKIKDILIKFGGNHFDLPLVYFKLFILFTQLYIKIN